MFSILYYPFIFIRKYATTGPRLSKLERLLIIIPPKVFDILIGIMLGDGHIQRRSPTANSRLIYSQSENKHLYFYHVFSFFQIFCTQFYVPLVGKSGISKTGETLFKITFSTMALPCFNLIHSYFYDGITKIVPLNIYDLLTPIGLAFWIMDDGSRQNKGLHLSVYGFDSESVNRLLNVLQNKFNLKCSLHKHKRGLRIYILEESMPVLRSLVECYIIKSMAYKIGK